MLSCAERPAVRARLSSCLADIDRELSRLGHGDPLGLDDDDRDALRLFEMRQASLRVAGRGTPTVAPRVGGAGASARDSETAASGKDDPPRG